MTPTVSPAIPNPGVIWQQSTAFPCHDPNERIPEYGLEDTVEQSHQEAMLPLVEYVNDAIAIVRHGKTVYRNPAYLRLLGQSAADTLPLDFLDVVMPAERARVQAYTQQ